MLQRGEIQIAGGGELVVEAVAAVARGWSRSGDAPTRGGTWNIHLNVILVTKGFFIDYGALRRAWGDLNIECRRIGGTPIEAACALRECIKYAALAVSEKSTDDKHRNRAPGMVEWSDALLFEWIKAFKRFRRTRTYGVLYRLPKPEKLDLSEFVHVAIATWSSQRRGFVLRSPLLGSIPGDKSATAQERVAAWFDRLLPGGLAGAPGGNLAGARACEWKR